MKKKKNILVKMDIIKKGLCISCKNRVYALGGKNEKDQNCMYYRTGKHG